MRHVAVSGSVKVKVNRRRKAVYEDEDFEDEPSICKKPRVTETENGAEDPPQSFTEAQINEVVDHIETQQKFHAPFKKLSAVSGKLISIHQLDEYEGDDGAPPISSDDEEANVPGVPMADRDAPVFIPFRQGIYSFENICDSKKYKMLARSADVNRAFMRGTWEFTLLGTLMYDNGKELAIKCPFKDIAANRAEAKKYLKESFEKYLPLFSRFLAVEKTDATKDVLRTFSAGSYMNCRMRGGFKRMHPDLYVSKQGVEKPEKKRAGGKRSLKEVFGWQT